VAYEKTEVPVERSQGMIRKVSATSTRQEREAVAQQLRRDGWLLREIAEHMGVAIQTVHAWLSDPGGKRLRKRKESYSGTCDLCGGPTTGSYGPNAPTRCKGCITWTPEALLLWVRDWADEHGGIPPRRVDFRGGERAAKRHFGSWNGLLLAAGFELHTDRRPETTEAIFAALRTGERTVDIADRFGVTPSTIEERCRSRGLTVREVRRLRA
jgi:hypothetical protein